MLHLPLREHLAVDGEDPRSALAHVVDRLDQEASVSPPHALPAARRKFLTTDSRADPRV